MKRSAHQNSPQVYARLGGVLYLIIIAVGLTGEAFVRNTLIVAGDATVTALKIGANETMWRVSIAAELFLLLTAAVPLALIFYRLFRPVNRDLAVLVVLFNLVSITLEVGNKLHLLATLFPLGDATYLGAFDAQQRYVLAMFAVRSHSIGYSVNLIFFGWVCLLLGILIFRSRFLPRGIGVLMHVAGLCYLANSLSQIAAPAVAERLIPFILVPIFVAETSLCLWLLLKGVNVAQWQERVIVSSEAGVPSGVLL